MDGEGNGWWVVSYLKVKRPNFGLDCAIFFPAVHRIVVPQESVWRAAMGHCISLLRRPGARLLLLLLGLHLPLPSAWVEMASYKLRLCALPEAHGLATARQEVLQRAGQSGLHCRQRGRKAVRRASAQPSPKGKLITCIVLDWKYRDYMISFIFRSILYCSSWIRGWGAGENNGVVIITDNLLFYFLSSVYKIMVTYVVQQWLKIQEG